MISRLSSWLAEMIHVSGESSLSPDSRTGQDLMIDMKVSYRAGVDDWRPLLVAFVRQRPGTTHRGCSASG